MNKENELMWYYHFFIFQINPSYNACWLLCLQVLSLSLEDNLKPKYLYLVNELRNEVKSLTKYPMYLSLSLDQRIRPRHKFLVSLKKAPKGPFPLGYLVPTDESFCQRWDTSLDTYLAFRQRLLLKKFAEKYERKMWQIIINFVSVELWEYWKRTLL